MPFCISHWTAKAKTTIAWKSLKVSISGQILTSTQYIRKHQKEPAALGSTSCETGCRTTDSVQSVKVPSKLMKAPLACSQACFFQADSLYSKYHLIIQAMNTIFRFCQDNGWYKFSLLSSLSDDSIPDANSSFTVCGFLLIFQSQERFCF